MQPFGSIVTVYLGVRVVDRVLIRHGVFEAAASICTGRPIETQKIDSDVQPSIL